MNEEPQSIWKRTWRGPTKFFVWFALLAGAIFLTICCTGLLLDDNTRFTDLSPPALVVSVCVAVPAALATLFVRRVYSWHSFRRFLFGAVCLATLIALAYVQENVRGKWAWEKFKREWEAKGERFDLARLVPPPVPDAQNFALTPIVASSYAGLLNKDGHSLQPQNTNVVDRLKMATCHNKDQPPADGIGNWQKSGKSDLKAWQQYYRRLAATTNLFPVAPQAQSPAADVLLALSKYDSAIEEVRLASRLPCSRFPLGYDDEQQLFGMALPHLGALKACAQVVLLRALAELQNGQNDRALEDLELSLRLADSIRTEPLLVSHLVRIAILKLALQLVWEGLVEHKWPDAQLREFDRGLAGLDFLADYRLAMRCEMLSQIATSDYFRRHPEELPDQISSETGSSWSLPPPILCQLIPSGWFYQNQLRCVRTMVQHYLPAADLNRRIMSPELIRNAQTREEAVQTQRGPYNLLEQLMLPGLQTCARKFANIQNSVDLARVACALERYRLAHGQYPESLDALAPQFISRLPHDVIGGQPLKYRRTEDSQFVLYSIGWNETDDGGVLPATLGGSSVDVTKGDWVWRYPAK